MGRYYTDLRQNGDRMGKYRLCDLFYGRSIWAIGGLQLLAIGIVGEYIGKIYMEVKARPRYIISERTWTKQNEDEEKGE